MDLNRTAQLEQGAIGGLLLRFSAPAIAGMMAQAFYNLIDAVFVGRAMGDDAIAGISVAFPFMLVVLAFGMLVGFGAASQISIRLGERRKSEAERILGNALVLLIVSSLLITAAGLLLLDPMLLLFGATETVLPYARDYQQIIVLGTLFQTLAFGLSAAIRAEGNPRVAMLSMLASVLLNAILAPIFIFGFRWGMRGAALATVIAQAVAAAWAISYFLGGWSLLRFQLRNLRLDGPICRSIVVIGSPPCMMQLAASAMQGVLNHQLGIYGGVAAIAVMGIIFRVFMIIAMPIFGINQGAQPIIGYNYGARRFHRVKRTLQIAIVAASSIMAGGFIVMMLFPAALIRLFDPGNEELISLGSHAIRVVAVMMPLVGFQIVSASYFQAVGKPREAMLLMLSRQALILIPALVLLPPLFGLDGVWAAIPVADFTSSMVTGICLYLELRHLTRRGAEQTAQA